MNDITTRKFPSQTFLSWTPLLCCIAASLLTKIIAQMILAIGHFDWSKSISWRAMAIAITIPVCWTSIVIVLRRTHILNLSRSLQLLFAIVFIAVAGNAIWQFWHFIPYGDAYGFSTWIGTNEVFPRWFLGSAIFTRIYQSLWPTIGPHLPHNLVTADSFTRITGAALMSCSSIVFLRYYGTRFLILIPILSPIWLLFCSGYDEYYPFIAWGYMLFLFLLFEGLEKRSPLFIAVTSSALCLSYGAFIPLALLLIACYGLSTNIRKAIPVIFMTALLCICAVILLWPGTMLSFIISYVRELPTGEQNIFFEPYLHKSAGPMSPFFALSYALSFEHIFHLCFMFFFGAGPIMSLSFAGGLLACWKKKLFAQVPGMKPVPGLFICLTLQFLYFFFMLPKLGFIRDIDLFFTTYLTFGFFAGMLLDTFLNTVRDEVRHLWKEGITASMLSCSTVILVQMLGVGF